MDIKNGLKFELNVKTLQLL